MRRSGRPARRRRRATSAKPLLAGACRQPSESRARIGNARAIMRRPVHGQPRRCPRLLDDVDERQAGAEPARHRRRRRDVAARIAAEVDGGQHPRSWPVTSLHRSRHRRRHGEHWHRCACQQPGRGRPEEHPRRAAQSLPSRRRRDPPCCVGRPSESPSAGCPSATEATIVCGAGSDTDGLRDEARQLLGTLRHQRLLVIGCGSRRDEEGVVDVEHRQRAAGAVRDGRGVLQTPPLRGRRNRPGTGCWQTATTRRRRRGDDAIDLSIKCARGLSARLAGLADSVPHDFAREVTVLMSLLLRPRFPRSVLIVGAAALVLLGGVAGRRRAGHDSRCPI